VCAQRGRRRHVMLGEAGVDGRGKRGGEGKRRCGEELGCWMHVGGIV
jgi:hypothetical protein